MNKFVGSWMKWRKRSGSFLLGELLRRFISYSFLTHFRLLLVKEKQFILAPPLTKKKLKGVTLLSLLLMIAFIAACGGVTHTEVPASKLSPSTCRVVQDAMGKTCVPVSPQRLIAISHFDLGHVLSLSIQPIGTSRSADIEYLGERMEGIEEVGFQNNLNLEKILSLKPDLILGVKGHPSNSLLSQISPTVLLDYWHNNPNDKFPWKENFNIVAKILGKEEAAQQAWKQYYQRIDWLKAALSIGAASPQENHYKDKEISVFEIATPGNRIYLYDQNSFAGSILDDVGLQRPKSQIGTVNSEPLSVEKLEDIDGDVMFVLILGDAGKKAFDELQQNPLWKRLKAVQNGQVYTVNRQPWYAGNLIAANIVIDDLYK